MRITIGFLLGLFLACANPCWAFEKQRLTYSLGPDRKPEVSFEFEGLVLKEPLDLLKKGEIKAPELRQLHAFFNKLYSANKDGGKKEVLAIWNPPERAALEKEIDPASEKTNRDRFQAVTEMRLKMVLLYGEYRVCFVEMVFSSGQRFVMKYPLIPVGKELFLTNKLNGDYFYDNISHLLDKEHYQMNLQN